MNVFEKWSSSIWDFIEGKNLLEQAHVNINPSFSFEDERWRAEKTAFGEDNTLTDVAEFTVPMWLVRAARKHLSVHNYRVSGCVNHKWIHTFQGETTIKSWEFGRKHLSITVTIKHRGNLIFLSASQ